jgi:hypothetical protein
MFITGEYADGWPSAGMLGYVQPESCETWLDRLILGFAARTVEIRAHSSLAAAGWEELTLRNVHTSHHQRGLSKLGPIQIYHLPLEFT